MQYFCSYKLCYCYILPRIPLWHAMTYAFYISFAQIFFRVDQFSGRVRVSRPLPNDIAEEYQLRILVTDGGSPALSNSTIVRIRINRNVCQPQFDPNFRDYTITIPETQPLGRSTFIGVQSLLFLDLVKLLEFQLLKCVVFSFSFCLAFRCL